MKTMIPRWAAVFLIGTLPAFAANAGCTKYEYAEVKDMSAHEATLAYCNQVFSKNLIQHRKGMYERIRAEETAKLGAPSNPTTQKIIEAGAEESVCDREMDKLKKRLFALKVPLSGKCDDLPKVQ